MSQSGSKVYLNVYDLHENNDMLHPLGLGLFHSGVQVGRTEYTFAGGAGIYTHEPKAVPAGVKLRESIEMGTFTGTSSTIDKIISEMRSDYQGTDYHVLNRNCNAFADDFLQRLLGVPAPGFVNRMAFIGSFFSCLLPENLNQDPTQQQNQSSSSGSSYNTGTTGRSSGGVYRTARTSTPAPKMVSGTSGVKLGGAGLSTSSVNVNLDDNVNLVDRRERMRQAALNRQAGAN
eukprot:CAMPEP_0184986944 /NCGR_PEP_ID=MMETSP1098-20130426/18471_1 /TAXON_ID=89044 /ORGANISM="Spumella elongata, Strain CCAP 955/1" /LENGTH=231 /DNA_ID=CAMNT_0027511335 /DNA_START=75 /DNA_END=770 /DNA_ORIENTATION=+